MRITHYLFIAVAAAMQPVLSTAQFSAPASQSVPNGSIRTTPRGKNCTVPVTAAQKATISQWMTTSGGVRFLENKGQMLGSDEKPVKDLLFDASGGGVDMYVTTGGLSYVFTHSTFYKKHIGDPNVGFEGDSVSQHYCRADMVLVGADIRKENIVKEEESTDYNNYYLGNITALNVHYYERITVKNIYPGIDWVLYTAKGANDVTRGEKGLQYDFVVHPGADASLIKLRYKWTDKPEMQNDGSMKITLPIGYIEEGTPASHATDAYDNIHTDYTLEKNGEIGFALSNYNKNESVVIDPALSWGTYVDGTSGTSAYSSIWSDGTDVFVLGQTASATFPVTNPNGYVFYQGTLTTAAENLTISEFSVAGARVWVTYYGGTTASESDNQQAISGDGTYIWITAAITTAGASFPTANPNNYDWYQTNTSMTWAPPAGSTYTFGLGATVESTGSNGKSITGQTMTYTDGALVVGQFTKSNGTRDYMSYVSAVSNTSGQTQSRSIMDDGTHVWLGGAETTGNTVIILQPGWYNGATGSGNGMFMAFNASGAQIGDLIWSALTPGSSSSIVTAIGSDGTNVYFGGLSAASGDVPILTKAGAYNNGTYGPDNCGFVSEFACATGTLEWGTYITGNASELPSGSRSEFVNNCYVDGTHVWINGYTTSSNLASTGSPTLMPKPGGAYNVTTNTTTGFRPFIAEFTESTDAPLWGTYFGGSVTGESSYAGGLSKDANGNVWMSGETSSLNTFPTSNSGGYYKSALGSATDNGWIAEFNSGGVLLWGSYVGGTASGEVTTLGGGSGGSCIFSTGQGVYAVGNTTNSTLAGGFPLQQNGSAYYQSTITAATQTSYIVAFGLFSATLSASANVACPGSMVTFTATVAGGSSPYTYSWSSSNTNNPPPATTSISASSYTTTATFTSTTTYTVTVYSGSSSATAKVAVSSPLPLRDSIASISYPGCSGANGSVTVGVKYGVTPYTYSWNPGGQTTATASNLSQGTYTVLVSDNCGTTATASATITLPAGTIVWTGAAGSGSQNDWNNPGNWCSNTVPTNTTPVLIPFTGIINFPTANTGTNAVCAGLIVNQGAQLQYPQPLTVYGNVLNNGTIVAGSYLGVKNGNWTNNATFTPGTFTVEFYGSTAQTIDATTFNTLDINNTGGVTNITTITATNLTVGDTTNGSSDTLGTNMTVSGVVKLGTASVTGTLNGGSYTLILSGSGTPFVINADGVFSPGTGSVTYTGTSATNVAATTYYNANVSGATTYTLLGNTTVTNVLTIGAPSTLSGTTTPYTLNLAGSGTPFVDNNTTTASFTADSLTVLYSGTSATTILGAINAGTVVIDYYRLTVQPASGSATYTIPGLSSLTTYNADIAATGGTAGSIVVTKVLTVASGATLSMGQYSLLDLAGAGEPFQIASGGTFYAGSSAPNYLGVGTASPNIPNDVTYQTTGTTQYITPATYDSLFLAATSATATAFLGNTTCLGSGTIESTHNVYLNNSTLTAAIPGYPAQTGHHLDCGYELNISNGGTAFYMQFTTSDTGAAIAAGKVTVSSGGGAINYLYMDAGPSAPQYTSIVNTVNFFSLEGTSGDNHVVDFGNSSVPKQNQFNVSGSFLKSGASDFSTSGSAWNGAFYFDGNGAAQTFSCTTASLHTSYIVNPGAYVMVAAAFTLGTTADGTATPRSAFRVYGTLDAQANVLSGPVAAETYDTLTVESGGTLKTSNLNGILSTTVGTVSTTLLGDYNTNANFWFYPAGTANANFPLTAPSSYPQTVNSMNNLTIEETTAADSIYLCGSVTQPAAITVNGTLTLAAGRATVKTGILTMGATSTVNNVNPPHTYIIADIPGGGVSYGFGGQGSFTYPIGDYKAANDTEDYAPVTINANPGSTFPVTITMISKGSKEPNNASTTSYLNRYWRLTPSGSGSLSYGFTGNYLHGANSPAVTDITGTEASIASAVWNSTTSGWTQYGGVNTGTHTINATSASATIPNFDDLTGMTGTSVTLAATAGCNLTATFAGTSPYTYSWSTSATGSGTSINASISLTTAGTYSIRLTDASGATATASYTYTALSLTTTQTNVNCAGTSTGSATASVSGGTTPYTYLWSTSPTKSTASVTGLSAGTYTITLTDHVGCTASASVSISQPPALSASASVVTEATCSGQNTGSASASATGGVTPYTYLWNDPNAQTTPLATGLAAGTYTVTVTGNLGCSQNATVTITQPPGLSLTSTVTAMPTCYGATGGAATVNVSGGTSPYTYSWSPTGGSSASANSLDAGIYTVTVTDANGCSATIAVNVTQPSMLDATLGSIMYPTCTGSPGSAMVAVMGGTGPYTYSWSPNSNSTATGTGLGVGTYTITVQDANGCSSTVNVNMP